MEEQQKIKGRLVLFLALSLCVSVRSGSGELSEDGLERETVKENIGKLDGSNLRGSMNQWHERTRQAARATDAPVLCCVVVDCVTQFTILLTYYL